MVKPDENKKKFKQLEPDIKLLKKLFKKQQKEYIRKRLKAILWLWEGKSWTEIIDKLDIDRDSLRKWVKTLIDHGVKKGLKLLAQAKKVKQPTKLSPEQEAILIEIIENEKPTDYDYHQNIFTAKILIEIVKKKWQIKLSDQSIYNILHRHKFSYQRGHRDYENADPELQKSYVSKLKTALEEKTEAEKMVFFDEFSVTNRPTIFYGWAPVNTKFTVPSNEKRKRERLNGLLAVDALTGEEYIKLNPEAKSEDIAAYFYGLAVDTQREGYQQLTIILDNSPTHKKKMRRLLYLKTEANPDLKHFRFKFIDTPSYSPDFNLAEYIIHQLRLQLLHHLPANVTLQDIKHKIAVFLKSNQLQSTSQILNTVNHILKFGGL